MTANDRHLRRIFLAMLMLSAAGKPAWAGPLRDRLAERRATQVQDELDEEDIDATAAVLPPGVQLVRDVAYGRDDDQRFDVYLPSNGVRNAPVILMAHGGGWYRGDKAMRSVVANKVAHWVPKGFIFISTNYRLIPQAGPIEQAEDVARAIAVAQRNAASWGGDPSKFILMGHSAGGHLVALVNAEYDKAQRLGAERWLGTVMLDAGALDVVKRMENRHPPLFDRAFGSDPLYWRRASPYHRLTAGAPPMLSVCAAGRAESVQQSREFAAKANAMGIRTEVSAQDLTHREINVRLGTAGAYTATVDAFIASLLR